MEDWFLKLSRGGLIDLDGEWYGKKLDGHQGIYIFSEQDLPGPEQRCRMLIGSSNTMDFLPSGPSGCNVKLPIRKKANLTAGFRHLYRYWASPLHAALP